MRVRLPEADPAASPELERAFAEFRRTRGFVSNIMRAYAHAPAGLAALAELGRYCRYDTALSELQKELAILITGRGVAYAWHHHAPLGLKAGLSEAQLDAVRRGEVPEGLSAADGALAAYAFAVAALRGVPEPVFAGMREHFTPRQITDVNLIVGYYLAIAATVIACEVEPDPPDEVAAGTAFHAKGAAR
jgi:4-carboxymuconolactone decarboxylase